MQGRADCGLLRWIESDGGQESLGVGHWLQDSPAGGSRHTHAFLACDPAIDSNLAYVTALGFRLLSSLCMQPLLHETPLLILPNKASNAFLHFGGICRKWSMEHPMFAID